MIITNGKRISDSQEKNFERASYQVLLEFIRRN